MLGQDISFPVIISPTGVQVVDPEGEVAVARAAAAAGTAIGLSSFASRLVEDVAAANEKCSGVARHSGEARAQGHGAIRARGHPAAPARAGRSTSAPPRSRLQILRSGVDEALFGLGRSSIHELVHQDLIIPPDFPREPQK